MDIRKLNGLYKMGLWLIAGVVLILLLGMNVLQDNRHLNLLLMVAIGVTVVWVLTFALLRFKARRDSNPRKKELQNAEKTHARK
ncbi:MAG: hypothetical protein I3J02_05315 [Prevotella sp.]|nr:hypothetical protein [Prevotella sp.]